MWLGTALHSELDNCCFISGLSTGEELGQKKKKSTGEERFNSVPKHERGRQWNPTKQRKLLLSTHHPTKQLGGLVGERDSIKNILFPFLGIFFNQEAFILLGIFNQEARVISWFTLSACLKSISLCYLQKMLIFIYFFSNLHFCKYMNCSADLRSVGGRRRNHIWSLQRGLWLLYGVWFASFLTSSVFCCWEQSRVSIFIDPFFSW